MNVLRYFLTASLLFIVWQHAHWSVALFCTLESIASEIHTSNTLKVAAILKGMAEVIPRRNS